MTDEDDEIQIDEMREVEDLVTQEFTKMSAVERYAQYHYILTQYEHNSMEGGMNLSRKTIASLTEFAKVEDPVEAALASFLLGVADCNLDGVKVEDGYKDNGIWMAVFERFNAIDMGQQKDKIIPDPISKSGTADVGAFLERWKHYTVGRLLDILKDDIVSNLSEERQEQVEEAFEALDLSPEIADNFDDLVVILLDVFQQVGLPDSCMIALSGMLFTKFYKDDDAVLSFSEASLATLHKLTEEGSKAGTGTTTTTTTTVSNLAYYLLAFYSRDEKDFRAAEEAGLFLPTNTASSDALVVGEKHISIKDFLKKLSKLGEKVQKQGGEGAPKKMKPNAD